MSDNCSKCGGKLNEVSRSEKHAPNGSGFDGKQYPSTSYHEVQVTYYKECSKCSARFGPFQFNYLDGM